MTGGADGGAAPSGFPIPPTATKEACDNAHTIKWERGKDGKPAMKDDPLAGKRGLGTNWRCLPDTVDLRGPKGARP